MLKRLTLFGGATVTATALLAACSSPSPSSSYSSFNALPSVQQNTGVGAGASSTKIDSIIDPGLPANERQIMHDALLSVPANELVHGAILRTEDGRIHATSRALLAFERKQQRLFSGSMMPSDEIGGEGAHDVVGDVRPDSCGIRNLGGQTTGEYRRVYSECEGYTQQVVTFASKRCQISDYTDTGKHLHGVYEGAYEQSGGAGVVDAGFVYKRTSTSDGGHWTQTMKGMYGPNISCGIGTYSNPYTLTLSLAKVSSQTIQWNFFASVGAVSGMVLMWKAPSSQFAIDGSNFVFRRLTAIALPQSLWTNGDWFGFPDNGNGGPNLSDPDIAFTSTTVNGKQLYGGANPIAVAERNPTQYNDIYDVICGEDSDWGQPANFNDFEGINLHNANTSGTFTPTECHPMETSLTRKNAE
jgi:hypothetical protein